MAFLPQLPNDLIEIIFERIPTKEITQCKLLSREWNYQISSPDFIRRHLARMRSQNRFITLLQPEHVFMPLHYLETDDGQQLHRRGIYEGMLEYEYVGSCESVILVANDKDEIYLLNPTTTKKFNLPHNSICFPTTTRSSSVLFGVGFNPMEGDYQVLRLSLFHCMKSKTEFKIYSKRSNRWRDLGEFPYPNLVNNPGAYANYCVHWILFTDHIVAFSLVSESFRLIKLPTQVNRNYRHHSFTTLNNDTLVLLPTFYMGNERLDLWILTDYNDDTSWERHAVDLQSPIREVYRVINFQPLYFIEPNWRKIVFRVNPLGTFWSWDLKAHVIRAYAGEEVINIPSSTFSIVASLS